MKVNRGNCLGEEEEEEEEEKDEKICLLFFIKKRGKDGKDMFKFVERIKLFKSFFIINCLNKIEIIIHLFTIYLSVKE